MYVSLQDVRNLGYRKILQKFLNGQDIELLNYNLMVSNRDLAEITTTPYGYMKNFEIIRNLDGVDGLKALMTAVEPLIFINGNYNDASKRKFRNMWYAMWSDFCVANRLSMQIKTDLLEVGLKIPLFLASIPTEDSEIGYVDQGAISRYKELLLLINSVVMWQLMTLSESDLNYRGADIFDIITMISEVDGISFIERVLKEQIDG